MKTLAQITFFCAIGFVVYGVSLIFVPAAIIIGGLALMVVSIALAHAAEAKREEGRAND